MTIYNFTVKDNHGNMVSLEKYKGNVLLIVNTATKCGLTPQYEALQKLYDTYHHRGLEILDFPCNQFKEQAPGTDEEINEFCTLNYQTTFPRFARIDVNGRDTEPLYVWLKGQAPTDKSTIKAKAFETMVKPITKGNAPNDIKWNFGKFLVDKNGVVVARYSPAYTPEKLDKDIEKLLN